MIPIPPVLRIIVQSADGHSSVALDATTGIILLPGAGSGVIVHNGKMYSFPAADPSAKTDAGAGTDFAATLLAPIAMAKPGDDLSALISSQLPPGVVLLEPGDYPAFHVP